MNRLSLFTLTSLLFIISCSDQVNPEPRTLIYEIGSFLEAKGYEVVIQDENNLTASGAFEKIDFLKFINEFYESRGYANVYDLEGLTQARIDEIECYLGPIYHSGPEAACQNTACFNDGELINFYTTCVACLCNE